ncbi:MAG: hypothetical protein ACJATM_001319 [Alphaproteobacteria bacterium]|jgi:hypothetical protein
MNPFDLRFSDRGRNSLSAQENELNKISYNESPSFNETDQTNYELRDQIRATYSKQSVIPLVTKFNPDKDFVSKTFAQNQLAIVPQDVSDPVFENTNASEEDLRFASFAKDVYSDTANRSDLDGYKYTPEFSSDKYGTYISDDDIVFSVKGTTTETLPETIGNLAKNTAIAFGVPTVPGSDKSYVQQLIAGASTPSVATGLLGASAIVGGLVSGPALVATGALTGLSLLGTGLLYNDLDTFQSEIDKIKETYPNKKINITGHSQGGTYANLLGINNKDTDVVTYNAGKGLINIYNDIKCEYGDCSNIKNYRIVGDFASMLPSDFQVGESFQIKPKIPDPQTQLEAKSAESFFIPSDLYIPHNIRNFQDRDLKKLMPDYGLFGRTLARRTGTATGLAISGLAPKVAPVILKGGRYVKDALGLGVSQRASIATQELGILGEAVTRRPVGVTPQNFLDLQRGISGTNLTRSSQILQQRIESNLGSQLEQASRSIRNVESAARNANEAFVTTNQTLGYVAGGGLGDVTLGLTYDAWFKPQENELQSF